MTYLGRSSDDRFAAIPLAAKDTAMSAATASTSQVFLLISIVAPCYQATLPPASVRRVLPPHARGEAVRTGVVAGALRTMRPPSSVLA